MDHPPFRPGSHELHFLEPSLITDARIEMMGVVSEPVQTIASRFCENFDRAISPYAVVHQAMAHSFSAAIAMTNAFKALGFDDHTDVFSPEAREAYGKACTDAVIEQYNRAIADPEAHRVLSMAVFQAFTDLLLLSQDLGRHGLETVLATMLINAWTAFECAAQDLWIDLVNQRPHLGINAINGDDGPQEQKKKSDVHRFIESAINDDEPIQAGTLLARTSKFDFNRFNGIQRSYGFIFGKSEMDHVFSSESFGQLGVLESLRNALAHNAGKVDKMFYLRAKRDTNHAKFGFNALAIADLIPIDGIIVRTLLDSAIVATRELLLFVDDWVLSHPE